MKWIDPLGSCKDDIITYRGDDRSPDEIFRDGFKPKGDSNDLLLHATDSWNPPSNFISTSPDENIATNFATSFDNNDGYVYYTRANNGIDINKVLGATPVNADGTWANYIILNPNRY
ncbi:scabin-related ADP-ribosyltransferase [Salmonella enterica]|uniref:scabin-related ADP-ribosyltransferase n=1 Tax=Salmonella enterica TaxID=28901 RepID=UPI003315DA2A